MSGATDGVDLGGLPDGIRFDERGLVPVIVQDAAGGAVLMLAYADAEALRRTLATGQGHYYSRSRQAPWRKGETSGNVQAVVEVSYDCDADAVLYKVVQSGPACHTGERSCFHRQLRLDDAGRSESGGEGAAEPVGTSAAPATPPAEIGVMIGLLEAVIADRLARLPEGSYVRRLHERGVGYVAQKVIEEAGESVVAALEGKDGELAAEAADLVFHLSVLLAERGLGWADVAARLRERHRVTPAPQG